MKAGLSLFYEFQNKWAGSFQMTLSLLRSYKAGYLWNKNKPLKKKNT